MKMDSLISVIIPVYNTEKYIGRCLDSVIGNTYKNLEIICVNDGSNDGSLSVLKEYEEKDKRIKIISQKNSGVSAARNAGLDAANGSYIAFIDSDDWVGPSCFSLMLEAALKENADIVKCGYKTVSDYERGMIIKKSNVPFRLMPEEESENLRYVWGLLYKSDIIKKYRFFTKLVLMEDTFFNTVLVAEELDSENKLKCICTDEMLYYYFQREDSALKNNVHSKGQLESAEEYLSYAEKAKTDAARGVYVERIFKAVLLYRYLEMFRGDYADVKRITKSVSIKALKLMKITDFSAGKKLFYQCMCRCPLMYRFMRIMTDRTMLEWEKEQKKNRQN